MATHFDSIGFQVDTLDDFNALVDAATPRSTPVPTFAGGAYLHFSTPEGCEFWMQMSPEKEIIGGHPHFAGTGGLAAGGFALDLVQTISGSGSPLDGGLQGTMADEGGCGCPVVFEVPDFRQHAARLTLPVRARVQLVGFAESLSIAENEEKFAQVQRAEAEVRDGDKRVTTMAAESFIPSGLFTTGGEASPVPAARAFLAGRILAWERRENSHSKRSFAIFTIRTLGGCLEIVAAPELVPCEPQVGGIVCGTFWLSGRLLDPLPSPPEAAHAEADEDQPDDWEGIGDIVNETFSMRAAKVPLNFLRYCRYSTPFRLFVQCMLLFASLAALLLFFRWWILGTLVALPALLLAAWLPRLRTYTARIFQNAALTPGVVVSTNPLEIVSLADMNTGGGPASLAVKRVALRALPGYSTAAGTRFPCVSGFQDGPTTKCWGNFDPVPLSHGTGDAQLLAERAARLDAAEFAELDALIAAGRIPTQADGILFVNDPPPATPPPLPKQPPPLPGT